MSWLYKIFSIKRSELPLLFYAMGFMFLLFASYAILRPLRDAMGLESGIKNLKWLFLTTFVVILCASILAMWLSTILKRKHYLNGIYLFFALNLLCMYVAMRTIAHDSVQFVWLARIFYVWTSVFNLFVLSSAWSLLTDVFRRDSSKRLFGIIAAGVSLGGIAGAALTKSLIALSLDLSVLVLFSVVLLGIALVCKHCLMRESYKLTEDKEEFVQRFQKPIGSKNPFAGFGLIVHSRYLLALMGFILLLSSVSTFLYMEQSRVIALHFPTKEARTQIFADINLIVQTLSFVIQIFFTAHIVRFFGMKWLLSLLGFVVGVGFVVLGITHPMFLPLVIVMVIRQVGEYALIKPGREMLFVPLDADSKYKVKNFFDTVVYRGGDAISAQLESVALRFGVSATLLLGALLSFMWGALGLYLAKHYEDKNIDK